MELIVWPDLPPEGVSSGVELLIPLRCAEPCCQLPEPLAELLAGHRLAYPAGPADPVFPGHLARYQRAQRAFQAACRRAGLHQVRLHDLRHTFGVHCARAGVPHGERNLRRGDLELARAEVDPSALVTNRQCQAAVRLRRRHTV